MLYTPRNFRLLLTIALVLATACSGFGQNLDTMQPFDMVVPTTYGGGTRPNEGFYFGMDYMAAFVSRPGTAKIGSDYGRGGRDVYYVDRTYTYTQTEKNDVQDDGTGTIVSTIIMTPTVTINPFDSFMVVSGQDTSSYDTSMISSEWTSGRRYDFGYMWGHHGLGVSIYDMDDLNQSYVVNGAKVGFNVADRPGTDHSWLYGITSINGTGNQTFPGNTNDANATYTYGELGVKFDTMDVTNITRANGVELNYTYRFSPQDRFAMRYGIWEFDLGIRYFQFEEEFDVYGRGGALADSWWNTQSTNNLIGPQIALRHFRTYGRWTLDFQTKFLAGINNQTVMQNGELGSALDKSYQTFTTRTDDGDTVTYTKSYYEYLGLQGYPGYPSTTSFTFNHRGTATVFSPMIEFRFNAKLQLTQLVNLRMGWTGMYIGNIARAAEMVNYDIPGTSNAMGINMSKNDGDSFVHGFTIGLEVNR